MSYRLLGISVLLMVFLGCTQNQVPDMPNFTTEEQKTCGQKCLTIHDRCSAACGEMFDSQQTKKQLKKCRCNCNSVLGDCYETCK